MPNVSTFARKMRKATQILCPFCKKGVPAPGRVRTVFTPEGCLSERCSCGAVYAVDETGHLGGQALLDAQANDAAAAAAWNERMQAMRDGCRAAIVALEFDGHLAKQWGMEEATDFLWTMLSVRNWEQLTQACGWSTSQYIRRMQAVARRTFKE